MRHVYDGKNPAWDDSVFVAGSADVIGDVEIGSGSSIWFGCVVRGDVHHIRIGNNTNIQDLTVVHVAAGKYPTIIGDDVTIGHRALIHACTIGNRCLIGMGAIIMDGAVIGDDCIIGAGSLVTEKTMVPSGSVVMGSPAVIKREIRDGEKSWIKKSAENYFQLSRKYLSEYAQK